MNAPGSLVQSLSLQLMPSVEIALGTYNGARFLPEQLASIAAQHWPNLAIVASDDGSDDATREILHTFTDCPLRLVPSSGRNGVRGNFARALAATTAPYVFLSDQDDYWEPEKVTDMMAHMAELERTHPPGHPILVCCNLAIVDAQLTSTGRSWFADTSKSPDAHDIADLAITGHVPGCAMAMNRALIAAALPIPDQAHIHDWWLALVAAAVGTIGYVDAPLIRYRQHASNTLGSASAIPAPWRKAARLLQNPVNGVNSLRATYALQARVALDNLRALDEALGNRMLPATRARLKQLIGTTWWPRFSVMRRARSGVSLVALIAITRLMGRIGP